MELSSDMVPTCLSSYSRCMAPCEPFTLCCTSDQLLTETGNWKLVFRIRCMYGRDVSLKKATPVMEETDYSRIGFQKWTVAWHIKARFFHKCEFFKSIS